MKLVVTVPWEALCSKNAKFVGRFDKVLSPKYRAAQELLGALALKAAKKHKWKRTDKACKLTWFITEPDHRKRDPYNYGECVLDALTKCSHDAIWWDDSQAQWGEFKNVGVDKANAGATITVEEL